MRRFLMRVFRILAQFVVAGGFTRAIDAWVVSLDPAWQLTVLAASQLCIAVAQAHLEETKAAKTSSGSRSHWRRSQSSSSSDEKFLRN